MRKLPTDLENPIDNVLVDICDILSPMFYKLHFTPNILTTFSLIFGLYSSYSLHNDLYKQAAIIYLISYFFDCCDGHYARKYKMVSKFGDLYDHTKDILIFILLHTLMFWKYRSKQSCISPYIVILIVCIYALVGIHIGCQELYYHHKKPSNESPTLSLTRKMCLGGKSLKDRERMLSFTRYFGCGTASIITSIILYSLSYYKC